MINEETTEATHMASFKLAVTPEGFVRLRVSEGIVEAGVIMGLEGAEQLSKTLAAVVAQLRRPEVASIEIGHGK
jgi:hypothetical protein